MLDMADKNAGLLLNLTGDGKGKTTAALGTALRALGWGWRVAILQFLKNDQPTGERRFFQEHFPEVLFEDCGLGLTCLPGDHAAQARSGWAQACGLLTGFGGELLVLDELNVALMQGYLEVDAVVAALAGRRRELNVIVTGRGAPESLLAASDLVSVITMVRHPYQRGIPARRGLDY